MRTNRPLKLIRYGLAAFTPGGRHICVCCGKNVWSFMPYRRGSRSTAPLMKSIGMIGSNVDQFECPRCGAHDRERHLLLYLKASGLLAHLTGRSIVHFAPEKRLPSHIAKAQPASYVRCDLNPTSSDTMQVDLLRMPFSTGSIDVLIANHVLEHVADDLMALHEIARVLRPGGTAILQTPYAGTLEATWSDPGIDSPLARLHAYGQEDHVRLYGRDIFRRIASARLIPEVATHQQLLPDIDPDVYGVNPAEPLFRFRRE